MPPLKTPGDKGFELWHPKKAKAKVHATEKVRDRRMTFRYLLRPIDRE